MKKLKLAMTMIGILISHVAEAQGAVAQFAETNKIIESLKESGLTSIVGQKMTQVSERMRPFLTNEEKTKLAQFEKQFSDLRISKLDFVVLNKVGGKESGVRMIFALGTESMTIDFYDEELKSAVIDGIVFSEADLKSMSSILHKLDVKNASSLPFRKSFVLFLIEQFLNIAHAAETCSDLYGEQKFCWDQINGAGSESEAIAIIKQNRAKGEVSTEKLLELSKETQTRFDGCLKYATCTPALVERLKSRQQIFARLDLPQQRASVATQSQPETRKAKAAGNANLSSDSWLKPTLVIAASLLTLRRLCTLKLICKKGSGGSSSDGAVTSNPSVPSYDGIGTK